MKTILLAGILALSNPGLSAKEISAPEGLKSAADGLLARRSMEDLGNARARQSIRGTKALWTELNLQRAAPSPAVDSLEADLKLTDMDGQLRSAGFRLMDDKKSSLALGLRPTLVLSVLFVPKASRGNTLGFYMVLAQAIQELTPLGGAKMSMTTWMSVGDPIPTTGIFSEDAESIRASARARVIDFIEAAKADAPGAAKP